MKLWTVTGRTLRTSVDHPLVRLVAQDEDPAVVARTEDGHVLGWALAHQWLAGWEELGGTVVAPGLGAADVDALVAALFAAAPEWAARVGWFGMERGVRVDLPAPWWANPDDAGDWDFMSARRVRLPEGHDGLPSGLRLLQLDDSDDAAEISAFNEVHNPRSEGTPGTGRSTLWLGVRDADERLLAVGAEQRLASGTPYFAGLVVHRDHRGHGLGAVVLAELARRALVEHDEVTLGVDADNHRAISLYERMGFATVLPFHSTGVLRG